MDLHRGVRDGVAASSMGGGSLTAVTFTVGKSCARFCVHVEIALSICLLPLAERSVESTWHPSSFGHDWLGTIGLDSYAGFVPQHRSVNRRYPHMRSEIALYSGIHIVDG